LSKVIYNGVYLSLTKINSLGQEPLYSEDGIDYLYTKFDLDVSAVVNLDAKLTMENEAVRTATTMSNYIGELTRQLNLPRKRLSVQLGADTAVYNQSVNGPLQMLLSSSAPDSRGGPFPRGVTIRQVGGSKTLLVQFQIQTFIFDQRCADRDVPKRVTSNRWEMSFGYDTEGMATRTTRGTLVVDGKQDGINADDFRYFAIPKIPSGWRRKRMDFNLSSDGLKIGYTIEDAEQYYAYPEGLTTVEGSYTESTTKAGALLYIDMDISVKGPKNVTKEWLVQKALQLIDSRVNWSNFPQNAANAGKSNDVLESASVSEDLFENKVSVKVRIFKAGDNLGNRKVVQSTLGKFGKPLSYEDFLGQTKKLEQDGTTGYVEKYGTAGLRGVYAAWHNDPCVDVDRLDDRTSEDKAVANKETESEDGPPTPPPPETTVSVDTENKWIESQSWGKKSNDHKRFPYTDCEIKQEIKTEKNIKALPVQRPPVRSIDDFPESVGELPKRKPISTDTPSNQQPSFGQTPSPSWSAPQREFWFPSDLIMLTPPMQERIVTFNAERAGAWPLIPRAFERLAGGDVMTYQHIRADSPTLAADGQTYVYSVSGIYKYLMPFYIDEQAKNSFMWAGKLQWTYEPFSSAETSPVFGVPPGNFQPLIADADVPKDFTDEELGIAGTA